MIQSFGKNRFPVILISWFFILFYDDNLGTKILYLPSTCSDSDWMTSYPTPAKGRFPPLSLCDCCQVCSVDTVVTWHEHFSLRRSTAVCLGSSHQGGGRGSAIKTGLPNRPAATSAGKLGWLRLCLLRVFHGITPFIRMSCWCLVSRK